MTYVRRERYLWLSWLSKLIAGDIQCAWSPWFRVRLAGYKRAPSDFDFDTWSALHNAHLTRLAAERRAKGDHVRIRHQNNFSLSVAPGLTLAGRPDLIATSPDGKITAYDVRTGPARPAYVDHMLLTMLYLPRTRRYFGQPVHGCVVYASGPRVHLPASSLHQYFENQAQSVIDLLNADSPPPRSPSHHECHFCSLTTEDCPDRADRPTPSEDRPTLLL